MSLFDVCVLITSFLRRKLIWWPVTYKRPHKRPKEIHQSAQCLWRSASSDFISSFHEMVQRGSRVSTRPWRIHHCFPRMKAIRSLFLFLFPPGALVAQTGVLFYSMRARARYLISMRNKFCPRVCTCVFCLFRSLRSHFISLPPGLGIGLEVVSTFCF